jgi:alpha-L-fucosidase
MKRRQFLGQGLAGASVLALPPLAGAHGSALPALAPEPDAAQRHWMGLRFGLFVHFGINTYYDEEWSQGQHSPQGFDPTELDTDQWCATAQRAGMKYVVLVTKHHDGFCNWPTAYTDYSVRSSRYQGDVVGELVKSARKHGLEVGFYYSLWDCHEKTHNADEPAYVEFMVHQVTELLTHYGPVVEFWLDGMWKKQSSGWSDPEGKRAKPEVFMQAWRNEGAYRWQIDRLYQLVKKLQPNCLVMNNATTEYPGVPLHPVDARSGEKATKVVEDQKVWTFAGKPRYLPLQIETTMSRQGHKGQFNSGSWFWHSGDTSVASVAQIKEWLDIAQRMEANLLLNVGPMTSGKLRPQDVEVLGKLAG